MYLDSHIYAFMYAKSLQSYLTLSDPVDGSLPGSSVHGILQARIFSRAAMPSSKGSSQLRDQTHISNVPCIWQEGSLPLAPPRKPSKIYCSCSVPQSCPTLCDPMDCSTPAFPILHYLWEFVQTYVHWVSDAIQPSHPLSPRSLPAINLSQLQGIFQWVGCLHQMATVLELQLQHQAFQ